MRSGTNSAAMRKANEKAILALINRAPISRVNISRELGLTKAAVTIIVDELISKGLISETPSSAPRIGRTPLLLSFSGHELFAIGINIARDNVYVGLCDFCGRVLSGTAFHTPSPSEFFDIIKPVVDEMVSSCKIPYERIAGLGVVTPGPVDLDGKRTLSPPNFEQWANVEVVEQLSGLFPLDISFSSVSKGVAVAQKYFGVAKHTDNFAALLINNDGIGSGLILGGKLFRGNTEIGHTSINYNGPICECGGRGCLEKYASISSLIRNTEHQCWKNVIDSGDYSIIGKEAQYLSTAIINTANAFDIDTVVLCGDICYGADKLAQLIQTKIDGRTLCHEGLSVVGGVKLPEALDASALAVHNFFV